MQSHVQRQTCRPTHKKKKQATHVQHKWASMPSTGHRHRARGMHATGDTDTTPSRQNGRGRNACSISAARPSCTEGCAASAAESISKLRPWSILLRLRCSTPVHQAAAPRRHGWVSSPHPRRGIAIRHVRWTNPAAALRHGVSSPHYAHHGLQAPFGGGGSRTLSQCACAAPRSCRDA